MRNTPKAAQMPKDEIGIIGVIAVAIKATQVVVEVAAIACRARLYLGQTGVFREQRAKDDFG